MGLITKCVLFSALLLQVSGAVPGLEQTSVITSHYASVDPIEKTIADVVARARAESDGTGASAVQAVTSVMKTFMNVLPERRSLLTEDADCTAAYGGAAMAVLLECTSAAGACPAACTTPINTFHADCKGKAFNSDGTVEAYTFITMQAMQLLAADPVCMAAFNPHVIDSTSTCTNAVDASSGSIVTVCSSANNADACSASCLAMIDNMKTKCTDNAQYTTTEGDVPVNTMQKAQADLSSPTSCDFAVTSSARAVSFVVAMLACAAVSLFF